MDEKCDVWSYLQQALDAEQSLPLPSIISFTKAIPDVRLDIETWGQQFPDVLFADTKQSVNLILPCQQLKSKTLLRAQSERQELIEMIDDLGALDVPDYEKTITKEILRVDAECQDTSQLALLLETTMIEDLFTGIETVLYANNNIFTGEIESINFTYLSKNLKNYSITDAIDKNTLTKDQRNPLLSKVVVGDELIDMDSLGLDQIGLNFLQMMSEAQQAQDSKLEILISRYDPKEPFQGYHSLSSNVQSQEFQSCWSIFVEDTKPKKEEEVVIQEEPQYLKQAFQNDEVNIISNHDVQFLSDMADVQMIAKRTAKINDIRDDEDDKEDDGDEQNEDDEEDEPFLQQVYYGRREDIEIQEMDPMIRQQIQDALKIKTKFKIIKASDISKSQNRLNMSTFRWSVEDDSNMGTFYDVLPKAKMAKQYPFELDDFQKRSILHLEKKESVFVCAHTSAGKTVVAEYAIALALRHNRRAMYTSPIKALSNQKFREFGTKFGVDKVGVVTGDVSINPGASCLILTTEILRNMLYRGAECVRDIEWVIFDEVHYVNDQERGMVWEETIIMLPSYIGIIMLSATVPNHMDFANWVGRTKKRQIYVMKTFTRPVPLVHHLYIFDKFHMVKEKDGGFLSEQYLNLKKKIDKVSAEVRGDREKIKKLMDEKKEDELYKNTNRSQKGKFDEKKLKSRFIMNVTSESMRFKEEKRAIVQLIRLCEKKELLPCVVFVFSKKKIAELASAFTETKGLKLIDAKTEGIVVNFFDKSLHKLKPQDRKIPQLIRLRELIRYGVAVHHGGLLPIAKEIVEILFSEGHIKVLLATETFAMGINMPTKTVIFHSIDKYDNSGQRMLHSSEYTQMSGRAGRRGMDEQGTVIVFVKDPNKLPSMMQLGKIIDHKGMELSSKFKMTYRIILNLLTSKDLDAAEMMKRSYHENYRYIQLPRNIQLLERLRKDYVQYSIVNCPYQKGIRSGIKRAPIEDYVELMQTFRHEQIEFVYGVIDRSKQPVAFPRYILFMDHAGEISLGIAIKIQLLENTSLKRDYLLAPAESSYYKLTILTIHCSRDTPRSSYRFRKIQLTYQNTIKFTPKQIRGKQGSDFYYTINEVGEEDVLDFLGEQPTQTKNSYMNTQDLQYDEFATQLLEKQMQYSTMKEMLTQLYSVQAQAIQSKRKTQQVGLSRLKYKFNKATKSMIRGNNTMTEEDDETTYWQHRDDQIKEVLDNMCHHCDLKESHLKQLTQKNKTKNELESVKKLLAAGEVESQSDFQSKLGILKRLGYIDLAGLPLIKARIAREIQDSNSIYVCEILVDNIMDKLNPSEIAALLSSFVSQQRGKKSDEDDGYAYLEKQLVEIEDDITYNLSSALYATFKVVKDIIQEEITLDALDVPDLGTQLRATLDFTLCPAVYDWAKGGQFVDICYETKIDEGQIVSTIQRLESLIRSIKNACKVIGNMDMVEKLDKASYLIKKDIVFAESLYFDPNAKVTAKVTK